MTRSYKLCHAKSMEEPPRFDNTPPPFGEDMPEPQFPIAPDLGSEGVPAGAQRWRTRQEASKSLNAAGHFKRRIDLEMTDESEDWAPQSKQAADEFRQLLGEPRCSEIHTLGPDQMFAKFDGVHNAFQTSFATEEDYNAFIRSLVEEAESIHDWEAIKRRRRSVLRMADGSSLTLVLPPFAPTINLSIRKHNLSTWQASDLVKNETMSQPMMDFLRACVRARVNMLIVGIPGTGKTSTLSLLTSDFEDTERIGIIEEIPEIWVAKQQVGYYTYNPSEKGLGLADILDSSLYMRFDRVIVGEVHMEGLTKMLETFMTASGMSTYHSNSVEQAVERMRIGLQLENPNMSAETAGAMIRNSVELVVVLSSVSGKQTLENPVYYVQYAHA